VGDKVAIAYAALWWVPVNHIPGIDEAKKRLAHLDRHGSAQFASRFKTMFSPDEELQRRIDRSSFQSYTAS
jgi:hypothetical protein